MNIFDTLFILYTIQLTNKIQYLLLLIPFYLYSHHTKRFHKITFHHHVKKNHLEAQLILSLFHQPLHVSGVSRPIIRRYNRIYTIFGSHHSF